MVAEVLDNLEGMVTDIVKASGMSKDEVEERIKKKQEEYGGLLTKAGAAYSITKEMGIAKEPEKRPEEFVKIRDIRKDLDSVDVVGVVSHVFPVREWEKNNRKGKVGNIIIKDSTGELRVALWNEDCDLIETGKVQKGTIVELHNAYTRERNELVELNIGGQGRVVIKKEAEGLPEVEETLTKLSGLKQGMNDFNAYARVVRIFPTREFQREEGTGKVASMIIADGTESRLVLWDSNTKWAQKLVPNDIIKVEGAYVRDNRGQLELNLGWRGRLLARPENAPELPEVESRSERTSVSDLKEGDKYREIRATIVNVFPPTVFEVCSKCGKKAAGKCAECDAPTRLTLIANAELDDGTGVIRGVFFRDMAEKLVGFSGAEYRSDEGIFKVGSLVGDEKVLRGQVQKNDMFQRVELVVREIADVDVDREIAIIKR